MNTITPSFGKIIWADDIPEATQKKIEPTLAEIDTLFWANSSEALNFKNSKLADVYIYNHPNAQPTESKFVALLSKHLRTEYITKNVKQGWEYLLTFVSDNNKAVSSVIPFTLDKRKKFKKEAVKHFLPWLQSRAEEYKRDHNEE